MEFPYWDCPISFRDWKLFLNVGRGDLADEAATKMPSPRPSPARKRGRGRRGCRSLEFRRSLASIPRGPNVRKNEGLGDSTAETQAGNPEGTLQLDMARW